MKRFMTGLLASLWMMSMTAMAGNTVEFPVRCEAPGTDETFTYELVKDGEVVQTLELKDGGSGAFTVGVDGAVRTEYAIRQRKGTDGNTDYDGREYTAIVYSDVIDGMLHAEPVLYLDPDGGKLAGCVFMNTVRPQEPGRPDDPEMPEDDVPMALPADRQTGVEAKTSLYLKGAAFCGAWIIGSALFLIMRHKGGKEDEIQE